MATESNEAVLGCYPPLATNIDLMKIRRTLDALRAAVLAAKGGAE